LDYDEAGAVPGQKKDMLASKKEEDDQQIGFIEGMTTNRKDVINTMLVQTSTGLTKFLEQWFGIVNAHHYFFLALLGVFTAAICFCADLITVYLIDKKLQLIRLASIEYHFRYLIYVIIVILGTMIAVSMS
jgi:hypothetical protein